MQAPLFIVWRESFEALLVIAILYAWLKREKLDSYIHKLWYGSFLGLFLAGLLALAFYFAGSWFAGSGGEWFFTAMMAVAALLIMQMVVWMHRNGKNMRKSLEADAQLRIKKSGGWGIMILAMLAVAREGSETVVFLAGVGAQQSTGFFSLFALGGVLGFILALLTFWILQKFGAILSWKWFFRITEIGLLLIGGGLFVSACDKAAQQLSIYDLPERFYDFMDTPLWDSSWLLRDSSSLTGLTGYHAMPSAMQVVALLMYWGVALLLCSKKLISAKYKVQPINA